MLLPSGESTRFIRPVDRPGPPRIKGEPHVFRIRSRIAQGVVLGVASVLVLAGCAGGNNSSNSVYDSGVKAFTVKDACPDLGPFGGEARPDRAP